MSQSFGVGRVVARSFSIWLRNLIPFTLLSVIVYAPLIIYTIVMLSGALTHEKVTMWGRVGGFGGFLLDLIVAGALVYGTFQQLRGRPAGMGAALVVGLKRLFPVLLVGVLVGLCVAAGMVLLIVPGVILLCMLWLAVPVAVVERPGILASLRRSRELTAGYRGSIFGILLLLGVIKFGTFQILSTTMIDANSSVGDVKLYLWMTLFVGILLGTLSAVANTVAYHDLRVEREGVGVEELARVFD